MVRVKQFGCAAVLCCAASMSSAVTLEAQYDVTAADSWHANRAMSLWINGGFADDLRGTFAFHDAGDMRMYSDGTAEITGRVVADDDAASGFDVHFWYDSVMEFTPEFKHQFGSVEHGNETYIDMEGALLEGYGRLAGLDLTLTRMPVAGPYATQMGGGILDEIGANNHNSNYGLANWFFVDSVLSATCAVCDDSRIAALETQFGDLNVDLTPVPIAPVPVPAAGFVMLGALAGLGLWRRRT